MPEVKAGRNDGRAYRALHRATVKRIWLTRGKSILGNSQLGLLRARPPRLSSIPRGVISRALRCKF